MKGQAIQTRVLSAQIIPNADKLLLERLNVPEGYVSLGLITTDSDDVSYAALDEATKKAQVTVVYAKSMYAGAPNASTLLQGEFIGILAAKDPSEVRSGLDAAINFIENVGHFYFANDSDTVMYFAELISQTGTYLSKVAGVPVGTPMAYLIAPPMEAMMGLDAAVKAAAVEISTFYGPPTETNFAGGLLTGDQAACKVACETFASTVCKIAETPVDINE